jgi:Carboxypeptidase regulatory-like domain
MRIYLACAWACLALCTGGLHAQFEYGEILGTVRDSSGGVVPHAKITLRGLETNVESSLLTNEQGNYSFVDLRAGNYQVSALLQGFRPAQSAALVLRVGDRLRKDLTLETGQVNEQVTVSGEATPLLETDTSSRGQVIQSQQIEQLPLNKRDYTQLVLLAPGTTYNPDQRLGARSASMATARCKTTISWTAPTITRMPRASAASAST